MLSTEDQTGRSMDWHNRRLHMHERTDAPNTQLSTKCLMQLLPRSPVFVFLYIFHAPRMSRDVMGCCLLQVDSLDWFACPITSSSL